MSGWFIETDSQLKLVEVSFDQCRRVAQHSPRLAFVDGADLFVLSESSSAFDGRDSWTAALPTPELVEIHPARLHQVDFDQESDRSRDYQEERFLLKWDEAAERGISDEPEIELIYTPAADAGVMLQPGLRVQVDAVVAGAGDNGFVEFTLRNYDYPDTPEPDSAFFFVTATDTLGAIPPVPIVNDTASVTILLLSHIGVFEITPRYVESASED